MTADLEAVRGAIDGDRRALCRALGMHADNGRFYCPQCQSDGLPHTDGDFSVEKGFKCHRCGWSGDGLGLVRLVRGGTFPEAVDFARSVYGVTAPTPPATSTKRKTHGTLDAAAEAAAWGLEARTKQTWTETRRDLYRDAEGRDVAAVLRFDRADGASKTYRPVHAAADGWRTGDPPGKWPLFMLPELLASEGTVYVAEGEKAACAGAEIGLTCTTSAHGAKAPAKTDWSPLAGRDVAVLPDNDEGGRRYAATVAALARAAGARSVRIVEMPGLPAKGDIADFTEARTGQTTEAIRAEVERLASAAPEWIPETEPETTAPDPIEAARVGTPYAQTDLGNAERLVARHGDAILWDTARGAWRTWDGRRWALDTALRVNALAAKTARAIRQEAAACPGGNGEGRDLGLKLFQHAVRSEARDRLAAMIEVAKARPGIAVAANTLDADPWALTVLNGTIDLRTGTLRPHNRADMITKLAPVEYRPGHRDPRFEQYLVDTTGGDAELAAFLQVAAGYTLTGDTSEEVLFLVFGPEAAGKTTFLEFMRTILGEYSRVVQADLLTRQRDARGAGAASPELAALAGARLAAASEMEQGREIAEALAKNLTGGEAITARHLYSPIFEFHPQFKLWMALNHCPRVSADDGALWRRILRIGFEHAVPPERRDKTLKPYLRNPAGGAPAILTWAVEGCLRWQKEGLIVPEAVKRSTAAYRQESDPLAAFMEDCIVFTEGPVWTAWSDLWSAYHEHAEENGTAEKYRVSPKRLQDRLRAYGCISERRHAGRGWLGVALQRDWQTPGRDARDACDASAKTFPYEGNLEKLCRKASQPTQPSRTPPGAPAPAALQPVFEEGFI